MIRVLRESPEIRWFEQRGTPRCDRCGKVAQGTLRGSRNESFGPHCKRCAEKRIRDSETVRAALAAKESPQ